VDLSRLLYRKCDRQQNPVGIFQGIPGFIVPELQEAFNHLDALFSPLTGTYFSDACYGCGKTGQTPNRRILPTPASLNYQKTAS
jgi:hypothetical protein